MSHLDDEALAALAMGDGLPDDAAHVAQCEQCHEELDAVEAMTRRLAGAAPVDLQAPPSRVWDAIREEIAGDAAVPVAPVATSASAATTASAAQPDDLATRRRRAPAWKLAVAAATGLVVGAGAVLAALTLGGADATATVIAQAPLANLATEAPAGTAVVETRPDGTEVLVIDTDATDVEDAYLEVWLIDENVEGMVSLGHLTGAQGEFVLPPGFDIAAFPIVDISVEPLDGIPTHSGDSVTRGVLEI